MPSESYINIGETDQKSVPELVFEPPKAESVGGERNLESKRYNLKEIFVSLSEAREKFGPILMHSKFSPKDLFCFKLKDLEFRKEIRRFETAEYQGFKRVLQDIEENVDFHDYLVSNGKFPDSETFREMILKAGMLDEGNIDGVMRRLEVFMKHSVDIDVFLLTVRNRMEAVAIRGGIKVEEVKKIIDTLEKEELVQDTFLNLIAQEVDLNKIVTGRSNMLSDVQDFVGLVSMLSGADTKVGGKVLEKMFIDLDMKEPGELYRTGWRTKIVEESFDLLGQFTGKEEASLLKVGQQRKFVENARKLEIVRFVVGLEKLQNETSGSVLPVVRKYTIGEKSSRTEDVESFALPSDGIVNLGFSDLRFVTTDQSWVFEDSEESSWVESKILPGSTETYKEPVWAHLWATLMHERQHIGFLNIMRESAVIDDDGIPSYLKDELIPAEHIVRIDQVDKVVETDYSSKLVAAIEEGWTRLHERLSIKFLLESKDAFSDGVNTDGIFILNKMKESRVFNDSLYMNHYWLGQQIVGAIFVDGFRGDVPDFNGGVVELMNIRKTNGLENVKKFLLKLDLEKIADPGSRRLFETTRFEEDVEAKEVRRKVWEEDGEKMRLVWKMDKKNTLLDYMTSTDPEKRRKGQEKFLELFGK